jgi:Zn-dependent M28 family amino/carboxypeptidase
LLVPAGTPRIVVGAHYDAFEETPGADDNASAVAGLLELARVLAERKPQLACQLELVAFTLEEPPFFRTQAMGSAIHARYLVEKRIKVRAMICLEMIGCFTDEPGSQQMPMGWLRKYYPKEGNFILVVGALGGKKLTRTVKEAMIRASDLPVLSISAPKAIEGIDFSDHLNYWKHGFDDVMLTDTAFYRNPRYHTKDDTPDTLDYVRMAKVVEGLYSAVLALQKAP